MADKEIAFRQPPGDRWKVEGSDVLFTSLTDALNSIYLQYKVSDFHIDAKKGVAAAEAEARAAPRFSASARLFMQFAVTTSSSPWCSSTRR